MLLCRLMVVVMMLISALERGNLNICFGNRKSASTYYWNGKEFANIREQVCDRGEK